ncbi:hypothetical protein Tco_0749350 [Tanacetum coccineum]|uniref:Uncharacterized protein n=1 Tax=Tanacetum coccineum TaxID=301880 RepID=A0ABQ4YY51_9ASTR
MNKDKRVRVKLTISASGSKPSGNAKNNRITRPSSSNQKNKVEDHSRKVKSSLNKMNFVSEPVSNAHVKHSVRNAKFESICAICNKCLFDATYDMCVMDYVNDVNVRAISKSKRNKMRKVWKPTGKSRLRSSKTKVSEGSLSSGPGFKLLTPGTISSGLVPNIHSSTLYVPPTKNDWEILFQLMFDEYLNPPPCVDPQVPAVIAPEPVISTGTPSSTTINQEAPSSSTSQTTQDTPPLFFPLGVEATDHDIEVAHMDNNPNVDFPISELSYEESST